MNTLNTENGIGEKLKRYRLSHLWTLQQMANITGLSVGALQKIETGVVDPHDLTVAKILKALPDFEEKTARPGGSHARSQAATETYRNESGAQ